MLWSVTLAMALPGFSFSVNPVAGTPSGEPPAVVVEKAPAEGFRPQAAVDADGVLHLVQGRADARTDLHYLRREPGHPEFSAPLPVNDEPGTVASFRMTVGAAGRVHVLMRPNPVYARTRKPDKEKLSLLDLDAMLYTRLANDGRSFEPTRDLSAETLGFEGVGALMCDGDTVHAFWHGQPEPVRLESARRIFHVVSRDAGANFTEPTAVAWDVEGACTCCAMNGAVGPDGAIALSFRNSKGPPQDHTKDSYLLVSRDGGDSFRSILLEPWPMAGCPGTNTSCLFDEGLLRVTWRTQQQVHLADSRDALHRVSSSPNGNTRSPQVVANHHGQLLFTWISMARTRSQGAGGLVWRVLDRDLQELSRGHVPNAASKGWGGVAAVARPDGSFLILHDGAGPKER